MAARIQPRTLPTLSGVCRKKFSQKCPHPRGKVASVYALSALAIDPPYPYLPRGGWTIAGDVGFGLGVVAILAERLKIVPLAGPAGAPREDMIGFNRRSLVPHDHTIDKAARAQAVSCGDCDAVGRGRAWRRNHDALRRCAGVLAHARDRSARELELCNPASCMGLVVHVASGRAGDWPRRNSRRTGWPKAEAPGGGPPGAFRLTM